LQGFCIGQILLQAVLLLASLFLNDAEARFDHGAHALNFHCVLEAVDLSQRLFEALVVVCLQLLAHKTFDFCQHFFEETSTLLVQL